jgi:hypothetical protein
MTEIQSHVSQKIVSLKRVFAKHPAYLQLSEEFQLLLDRRRAEIEAGIVFEARGIAVIGASGSGKTSAVARLITHTDGLVVDDPVEARKEIVSFQVPSPATLKFVGETALEAVGYPLQHRRTEMIIWDMVRQHLHARKTLFLHLDEAQDLVRHQTIAGLQSVVRTLKSLMQTKVWPVGLILSGMPELKDLLNHDPQLARRIVPIEFPRLVPDRHDKRVVSIVRDYASRVSLDVAMVLDGEFASRLMHAADREFGLLIEIIIEAIECALLEASDKLHQHHFTAAFRRRSGCLDAYNPFVAVNFERIDARALLKNEGKP